MRRPLAVLAATLAPLLAVAACGSPAAAPGTTTAGPSTSAAAQPPLDTAALEQTVTTMAADLLVPGVVVDVRSPRGTLQKSFGTGTRGGDTPIGLDDRVRVGSNTKTWTGTVILQLVGEGRLALTDPISRFRPDVPNGQNITIDMLLRMTSGLANYTTSVELNRALDQQPGRVWTPDELLRLAFTEPPVFAPGQGFLYSNTNTVLLGVVAEQLDAKPLRQVFADRLFTPLGMTGTSFPDVTDASIPSPHPQGYFFGTNEGTITSSELSDDDQAAARNGEVQPEDVTDTNPSWGWSAGAGISTANDLTTWVRALVGGTLLPADLQSARLAGTTPIDPDDPMSPAYGQNLAKFGPVYGHSGELPGFNSFMGYDPASDTSVVVWTNLAPSVEGKDPASGIAKALIQQIYQG